MYWEKARMCLAMSGSRGELVLLFWNSSWKIFSVCVNPFFFKYAVTYPAISSSSILQSKPPQAPTPSFTSPTFALSPFWILSSLPPREAPGKISLFVEVIFGIRSRIIANGLGLLLPFETWPTTVSNFVLSLNYSLQLGPPRRNINPKLWSSAIKHLLSNVHKRLFDPERKNKIKRRLLKRNTKISH